MANDQSYFTNKLRAAANTLYFALVDWSATDPSDDFVTTPAVHAAGDTKISQDGGAFANTTNGFAHLGNGIYSLDLTATEMDAAQIVVTVVDQSGPKIWKDRVLLIETARFSEGILRQERAQAGGASTITLDNAAPTTDDYFNGCLVGIVSGTGVGQARVIRDYAGATRVATVGRAWVTNPDATSIFVILPGGEVELDPYGRADVWDESEGAEPTSALASTATIRAIIQHFKRWAFNRSTATNTSRTIFKDDSVTALETQTFSSDGVTSDRGKAS